MVGLWWDLNNNGGFIVEEEEARLNCVGGVMQYQLILIPNTCPSVLPSSLGE